MSTLVEIQQAIVNLPADEKKALSLWLTSQAVPDLDREEEERLLRSLDEAVRDVEAGKGVAMADVRRRVASWAAK
jgi:hypothetical protein